MLTKIVWEMAIDTCEPVVFLWALCMSLVAIPIDILLFPLEIIAFIIYKIVEG